MATGDPPIQGFRFCNCVGYLYNKDGRCCMDMPQGQTVVSDRITIQPQPQPIAQGWQCPVCRSVMAPHVDRCTNCGPKTVQAVSTGTVRIGDTTTLPTWGTFTTGPRTVGEGE